MTGDQWFVSYLMLVGIFSAILWLCLEVRALRRTLIWRAARVRLAARPVMARWLADF
jgi:hypothetical protein